MRKLFLFLTYLLFSALIFSQTVFEGKVKHSLTAEKLNQKGTVEVFYGNQKIKGKIYMPAEEGIKEDEILIDFSKGILYHLYPLKKTYHLTHLKNKISSFPNLPATTQKKIILNLSCTSFFLKDTAKSEWMGEMDIMFWFADSLYFPVSEEYLTSDEIPLFTNGKTIGMGMNINMPFEGKDKNIFILTPTSIEKGAIPDSIFQIPINYKLLSDNSSTGDSILKDDPDSFIKTKIEVVDLEMVEIKGETPTPPPPSLPTTNKMPLKKKSNVKSTPIKRKQ
jgi:hypothetical protein